MHVGSDIIKDVSSSGSTYDLCNNDQVSYLNIDNVEGGPYRSYEDGPMTDMTLIGYPSRKETGEHLMTLKRKQEIVMVLDIKGVEGLNLKLLENRKSADLFEIGLDSFMEKASPEAMARFGIALINLSPFMRGSIIFALSRDDTTNNRFDTVKLKDIILRIIDKGFEWVEITPELDHETLVASRDATVRSGSKLLLRYDTTKFEMDRIEKALWSADGIKIVSEFSGIRDIKKLLSLIQMMRGIAPSLPIFLKSTGPYSHLVQSITPLMDIDGVFIEGDLSKFELAVSSRSGADPGFRSSLIRKHLGLIPETTIGHLSMRDKELSLDTGLYLFAGKPLKESLEVILHNHAFREAGIDAISLPLEIGSDDLDRLMLTTSELDIQGISLTMPLKTVTAKRMSSLDDQARRLGSINAVKIGYDGPVGFNTEYHAMKDVLMKYVKDPDSRIMVLGTGGAGKSFAAASNDMGFKTFICGSIPERTFSIAKSIGPNVGSVTLGAIPRLKGKIDVLINATPEGIKLIEAGNSAKIGIYEIALMLEPVFGFDLIYSPPWTPFLSIIESRGGVPVSGLEMLIHQVMRTHYLWTGMSVDYDDLRKVAIDAHPYMLKDRSG